MLKNITLSADEALIREARRQAALHNTTLNELFRDWLNQYLAQGDSSREATARQAEDLFQRLGSRFERKYTREEMNERR